MKKLGSCWYLWLILCSLWSGVGLANSYKKGLEAYKDGEYAKAFKVLGQVAVKAKSKSDRAEALALMGASVAKLGKKAKATQLFEKALSLDSNVSLPKEAAKDKKVRKIFAKAAKSSGDDDDSDDSGSSSGGGGFLTGPLRGVVPLGIGFFANGEVSKALIYGGAQAAGAIGYIYYNNEIAKANQDAADIGEQAKADKAANKPVDPAVISFLDDNEAFVKSAQSNQNIMVLLMLGGYGLSAVDPFIFGGSSKKSKKSRAALDPSDDEESLPLLAGEKPDFHVPLEEGLGWQQNLQILPLSDPSFFLNVRYRF